MLKFNFPQLVALIQNYNYPQLVALILINALRAMLLIIHVSPRRGASVQYTHSS